MSNSSKLFNEILKHLTRHAQLIEQANRLNLTDEASHAEDIFARILNLAFSLNLVSTNLASANSQTIDLVDINKGISFQITSNKKFKAKKDKTLDGFKKPEFKKLKSLIILFITSKQLPRELLEKKSVEKKSVECYDIDKLLKLIKSLSPTIKKNILAVLNEEFKTLEDIPLIDSHELKRLRGLQPVNNSLGLVVDRTSTVKAIYEMALLKHTLLIGLPGIGKSYVLNALNEQCWHSNLVAVTIRVNELHHGTNEEINDLLKTKDWFTYLKTIKSGQNQFLIFDAYDTAKDETLKHNILSAISRCVKNLPASWRVIVSVRTYDAQKSIKLQQIFTDNKIAINLASLSFEIPLLTDVELQNAISQNELADKIFSKCTKELKKVLRIPYFLKLYEFVLENGDRQSLGHLEAINTEEELLSIFWTSSINSKSNHLELEAALASVTKKMYEFENLNVTKGDILSVTPANLITELIAEGMLTETGVGTASIAYSHNILFDYAISNIIKTDVAGFTAQIEENPKRPFIYRASYLYLIKRVWKEDRTLFWKLYFSIFENSNKEFRIIHQIIFNSVLSISYSSRADIEPILAKSSSSEYDILTRRLLDIVRFSIGEFREMENMLISELVKKLVPNMLWHVGYFLDALFKNSKVDKCITAKAALSYINYALTERKAISNPASIDYYGGHLGVNTLVEAHKYNPKEAGMYVKDILEILKEDDFPINYFSTLSDKIDEIAKINSSLAATIFKEIYLKDESSTKETHFGSGVVVGFRSTRGQDFRMCHFRLEKYFPEYLQLDTKRAIELCLVLVNKLKVSNYGYRSKPVSVSCGCTISIFHADGNIGDWEHDYKEGSGKLLKELYDYLQEQINEGLSIQQSVQYIIKGNKAGFAWMNLFKFFAKNPQTGIGYIIPILTNEIFLVSNETAYNAGEWIKASIPFLKKDEIKILEKKVISLLDSSLFKTDDKERIGYWVAQTLSCFPAKVLTFVKSKTLSSKHKGAVNTPIVTHGGAWKSEEGNEDFVTKKNINVKKGVNKEVYQQFQELKKLNSLFEKTENINKAKSDKFFKLSDALHQLMGDGKLDENLRAECHYVIAEGINMASRGWKQMSKSRVNKCLSICSDYLNTKALKPAEFDRGSNHGLMLGYSESPRISSSYAIVNFSNRDDIAEVDNAIKGILDDNSIMVRVNAVRSLFFYYRNNKGEFWRIVSEQLQKETDDHVLASLLGKVTYRDTIKNFPVEIDSFLTNCSHLVEDRKRNSNTLKYFVTILLGAIELRDSKVAKEILQRSYFMNDFISEIISRFFNSLTVGPNKTKSSLYLSFLQSEIVNIIDANIEATKVLSLQDERISNHLKIVDYLFQRMFYSFEDRKPNVLTQSDLQLYSRYKSILQHFVDKSKETHEGFIVGHTGYYIVQILEKFVSHDPEDILILLAQMVALASKNGFANDKSTLEIIIRIIEVYLTDYRDIALKRENFMHLVQMLNYFVESGWQEALEMIWRLNEVF